MNLTPTFQPKTMTITVNGKTERIRFFRAEIADCLDQQKFATDDHDLRALQGRIKFMANQEAQLIRGLNRQKYSA